MTVRLCILGCGAIARLHSRVARTLGSRVRVSFASRSRDRAESYRRRFGGVGAFGSYETACGSPDVDAVLICTPHAFHVEHARLAAAGGKAMLIEKPVARSLEELSAIEACVQEAGVVCMVAENYRFKPLRRVLRDHLESGDIGEPLFIEINKTGTSRAQGWRMDAALMGGGALLEGGVHWVNLMMELGGSACRVIAAAPGVSTTPRAPVEDNLQVLIHFDRGAVGRLLHSWNTRNRTFGLQVSRIYGTEGNIFFESNGLWVVVAGRRRRLRVPGLFDLMGYRAMLQEFLSAVRENRDTAMPLSAARRDLEVVMAAYRSLTSRRFEVVGGPVTVESGEAT